MSELTSEEIEKKVLEYLSTVNMTKNKTIAKAIEIEKSLVDKAISKLAKEDKIEYLYLGTSFIKLKGK